MQNSTFLVLLRPIFAPKMKTALPNGFGEQKLWTTCRYLGQKSGFLFSGAQPKFFRKMEWILVNTFIFCLRSPNFGRKAVWISVKTFFFGDHLILGRTFFLEITWVWAEKRSEFRWRPFFFGRSPDFGQKNVSIWFKTDDNLSQVR